MLKKILPWLVGVVILLLIGGAWLYDHMMHMHHRQMQLSQDTGAATVFPTPRDIPLDIPLIDVNGQPTNLSRLKGQWAMLFFGFTHCPDVCPIAMGNLKVIVQGLPEGVPKPTVAMISVDPERDTASMMKAYVARYHSDFLGFTGERQHIEALSQALGVYAKADHSSHNTGEDDAHDQHEPLNYLVEHTSSFFLFNPEMKLVGLFSAPQIPADIISAYAEITARP